MRVKARRRCGWVLLMAVPASRLPQLGLDLVRLVARKTQKESEANPSKALRPTKTIASHHHPAPETGLQYLRTFTRSATKKSIAIEELKRIVILVSSDIMTQFQLHPSFCPLDFRTNQESRKCQGSLQQMPH